MSFYKQNNKIVNKNLKLEINKKSYTSRKSEGFTLIEVLVSSAILVILAAGFIGLQYITSQHQVSAWKNYLNVEAANNSLSLIARELRDARQSETGAYPLQTTNDQEIIFYSDYDYDGQAERIRYTLTGNQLSKGVIEPSGTPVSYPTINEKVKLATDIVRNGAIPVFSYYNSDWPSDTENNPLAPASRISDTREIKIYLKTNYKNNDSDNDYILETFVRLRMLD
ncbi:hypothetical protein A2159_00960 [Candidatus Woesebacteria bacterium RBG_13_34_9]|uniref:Type II secretion system protein J n=1 Tax=Candidatus Woesebacteria bacterium RBG_13_34_9 TaxID=1802477 RepID=A0A1F7X3M8_9BACT|nr:MAG: hypothetical protein A2159_00960 [Candidatus Woesebacteria bacterium RBG_13_34_9]